MGGAPLGPRRPRPRDLRREARPADAWPSRPFRPRREDRRRVWGGSFRREARPPQFPAGTEPRPAARGHGSCGVRAPPASGGRRFRRRGGPLREAARGVGRALGRRNPAGRRLVRRRAVDTRAHARQPHVLDSGSGRRLHGGHRPERDHAERGRRRGSRGSRTPLPQRHEVFRDARRARQDERQCDAAHRARRAGG